MRKTIRLLMVTCAGLGAVGGIDATVAQAAGPAAATGVATTITSSSAKVTGTIVPNGNAVDYQFQYGTSTSYNKTTPAVALGPSTTTESVSAVILGLAPGTTYHFRLAVLSEGTITSGGKVYYYPLGSDGADATFKTLGSAVPSSKGRLTLRSSKLHVKRGKASATIGCASLARCKGRITLSKRIKVGRTHKTVSYGSAPFSIKPGKRGVVKIKLSPAATTALGLARHHRTTATLTARTSTGQKGLKRTVTLIG